MEFRWQILPSISSELSVWQQSWYSNFLVILNFGQSTPAKSYNWINNVFFFSSKGVRCNRAENHTGSKYGALSSPWKILPLKQNISYGLKPTNVPKRIGDEWLAQVVADACPNHEKRSELLPSLQATRFLGPEQKKIGTEETVHMTKLTRYYVDVLSFDIFAASPRPLSVETRKVAVNLVWTPVDKKQAKAKPCQSEVNAQLNMPLRLMFTKGITASKCEEPFSNFGPSHPPACKNSQLLSLCS